VSQQPEPEHDDQLPVLAGPPRIVAGVQAQRSLSPSRISTMRPAVQAAAVAAGGFVAGAAVAGLVHRRHQRSPALRRPRGGAGTLARAGARGSQRASELVQIVGTRTLLVDVHLLGGAGPDR
jgi:hypothetical protein